ncbi:hypothetical protein CIPAW_01G082600 [Carya illinoinensis]|uniref:Uncharacterized protein n=1 Tax=Carya illinoinensis TaxID=32201 RepID=A0A8T1RMT8_CARIL|nr:hypothetical protein CIPAW_01G082600 [Carya illinoinensis]
MYYKCQYFQNFCCGGDSALNRKNGARKRYITLPS